MAKYIGSCTVYEPMYLALGLYRLIMGILRLNLEIHSNSGLTALWLAVKQIDSSYLTHQDKYNDCFAAKLLDHSADPDSIDMRTGNSLLHVITMETNEGGAIFLVCHGSRVNHSNHHGESSIHLAAKLGLHHLVTTLLQYGADPNMQTNRNERIAMPTSQISARNTPTLARVTPPVTAATNNSSGRSTKTPPISRGLSPTLGTLSALSGMGTGPNETYDAGLQQLSDWAQSSTWSHTPGLPRPPELPRPTSSNPFDSDHEDSDNVHALPTFAPPSIPSGGGSSGYRLLPMNPPRSGGTTPTGGTTPMGTSRSVSPDVSKISRV